jgi:hypothetical protein
MLTYVAWLCLKPVDDPSNRYLALHETLDDLDSGRVSQSSKDLRFELAKRLSVLFFYHFHRVK